MCNNQKITRIEPQRLLWQKARIIMNKTVFYIDDLFGYAWECAIRNVYKSLNDNIGLEPLDLTEHIGYQTIARELNIRFDVNGNII